MNHDENKHPIDKLNEIEHKIDNLSEKINSIKERSDIVYYVILGFSVFLAIRSFF